MDLVLNIVFVFIKKYFKSLLIISLFFTSSVLSALDCASLFTECLTQCEYSRVPSEFKNTDKKNQLNYSQLTLVKIKKFLNIYQKRLTKISKDLAKIKQPTVENTILRLEKLLAPLSFIEYFLGLNAAHDPVFSSNPSFKDLTLQIENIRNLFFKNPQILNNILQIYSVKDSLSLSKEESSTLNLYYRYIKDLYFKNSSSSKKDKTHTKNNNSNSDSDLDLDSNSDPSSVSNNPIYQLNDSTINSKEQKRIQQHLSRISTLRSAISSEISDFLSTHYITITTKSDISKFPVFLRQHYSDIASQVKQKNNILLIPLEDVDYLLSTLSNRYLREKIYKTSSTQLDMFYKKISKDIKRLTRSLDTLSYLSYNQPFIQEEFHTHFISNHKLLLEFISKTFPLINAKVSQKIKHLEAFANMINPNPKHKIELKPWDIEYYDNLYEDFIHDHFYPELQPYLEYNSVLEGILEVFSRLHSIKIVPKKNLHTFSDKAKVYEVLDSSSHSLGLLHIDHSISDNANKTYPFTIPIQQRVPILNFKPIVAVFFELESSDENSPFYLTVNDIVIMFHELGHALHYLLFDSKDSNNIIPSKLEDYDEFPSQFMEYFALHPQIIKMYAKHVTTRETIPHNLLKNFSYFNHNSAFESLTQLLGAYLDLFIATPEFQDISSTIKSLNISKGIDLDLTTSLFYSITDYSLVYYSYFLGSLLGANLFNYIKKHGIFSSTSIKKIQALLDTSKVKDLDSYYEVMGEYPDVQAYIDTISTK